VTTSETLRRPPFDPELEAALSVIAESLPSTLPSTVTPEMIPLMRITPIAVPLAQVLEGRNILHEEMAAPGYQDAELAMSVFRRPDHVAGGPAVYHIHGGGMIAGDRFAGADACVEWVERYDAVVVSVEYRLAPEHPDPIPVEDCYAGLVWFADHADELGFDPGQVVVAGGSAGGGLAAGVALLCRDRGGPTLLAQLLMCPMLDDRNDTISSHQFVGVGVWDRGSNDVGWDALLGERRRTDAVSIYAAPTRASDLSGLPPTFIDVGSAEVFRDEDVAYAMQIWADGGVAELHVWPGGFHGFQRMGGAATLARQSREAQRDWLDRILGHQATMT
jgi:acetyl esterase/lipase